MMNLDLFHETFDYVRICLRLLAVNQAGEGVGVCFELKKPFCSQRRCFASSRDLRCF